MFTDERQAIQVTLRDGSRLFFTIPRKLRGKAKAEAIEVAVELAERLAKRPHSV
ncbi:hypothetical protein [Streptosporangium sp. NPDC020145]|uniref:hypothetical protein n=1 Tax=Streptosporangium sp. NPDC020145 TaxID=3154694 RepID=UPI00343D4052